MRSDHLSKHSKIHAKKTKRSSAPEESSKIKTENPPVDEHRQLDDTVDEENLQVSPKPAYTQELSILTDQQSQQTASCANPVYNNSQKSPAPLFYPHLSNQASTMASHPYSHPNSVFYHFTNNPSNNHADTYNRSTIGNQNGSSADSQNGTTTSAYNEKYTYDNYHQYYPSQAQVYHINYGNGHNYP